MSNIYLYLLKSIISFSFFYSFYLIFLRKETFFQLNRYYLLSTLFFSVLTPLAEFNFFSNQVNTISELVYSTFAVQAPTSVRNPTQTALNLQQILSIIYISGTVFFLLRFLSKLIHIIYIVRRFGIVRQNNLRTVYLDGDQSPFNFFNILFLSRNQSETATYNEIIDHEKIHLIQYHSIDLLIMEILTIVFWLNPFIWLYKISIRTVHEYLADEGVILKGYDKINYQKLLITQSVGNPIFDITNYFNYSRLKNRFKMITKEKSKKVFTMKYLGVIPLMFLSFMFFSLNFNNVAIAQDKEGVSIKELDNSTEFTVETEKARKYIAKTVRYPKEAAKQNSQGRIFVKCIIDKSGNVTEVGIGNKKLPGTWNGLDEVVIVTLASDQNSDKKPGSLKSLEKEAIRVVSSLPDFSPAILNKKKVQCNLIFVINFMFQ